MDGGGGGGDAFSSSTAPLTWHDFLERMRHPSAADFVKSIKNFIVSFSNRAPDPEKDSVAVQEFLASMEGAFRAHTLWAGSSEEELESAGEGLEKYVMTKLYNRAFASFPEDVKQDEELYEKIALVQQFVRPEQLDIKPTFQNETSWLLAQKELQKINMYKAPRDKLVCILNCCKVINNLLLNAVIASNDNPPGADEFLPVLIYVIIKANPPQLCSNLLYIQRYRRQSRLVSEAAYYFTNILSAESFILSIDAHSLSMDETEFQKNMESARAQLLGLSSNLESDKGQTNQEVTENKIDGVKDKKDTHSYVKEKHAPHHAYEVTKDLSTKDTKLNKPSVSELEKKGASDILKEDQPNSYFQDYPFLYAQAGDLTIVDVESLLNSYKQLVFKYVSLAKGTGVTATTALNTSADVKTETKSEDAVQKEPNYENYEGLMRTDDGSSGSLLNLDDKGSNISKAGSDTVHTTAEKSEIFEPNYENYEGLMRTDDGSSGSLLNLDDKGSNISKADSDTVHTTAEKSEIFD